jgi:hypothetical protein
MKVYCNSITYIFGRLASNRADVLGGILTDVQWHDKKFESPPDRPPTLSSLVIRF